MKRGKQQNSHSRRGVLLAFLFIFFVGTCGLATVWLRQQIAVSAGRTSAMERRLVELGRQESRLTSDIAIAMSPSHLEAQNVRFQLGLRQAQEDQVVRIDSEQQIRFAENRWDKIVRLPEETSLSFYLPESN